MSKISEITLNVELDDENVPQKLSWKTTDHPDYHEFQEVKCFSLSMFDKSSKDTMKIDLWTNELQVIEMDRFIYQSIRSLADTYFKATNNRDLANSMQQFAEYFAEKTEITSPQS